MPSGMRWWISTASSPSVITSPRPSPASRKSSQARRSEMEKHSRIYVAGHRGLVGSAILNHLRRAGHSALLTRTHAELDLSDRRTVDAFFAAERPGYVILAAAKV